MIELQRIGRKRVPILKSEDQPRVGVILVDYHGSEHTIDCLASIFGLRRDFLNGMGLFYENFQVIIVDNGIDSLHGERIVKWCLDNKISYELLCSEVPPMHDEGLCFRNNKVIIVRIGENRGFAGGCNLGIRYALAQGDSYTWLLNNDTIVDPLSLPYLISTALEAEKRGIRAGIIGSKLRCFDHPERIQFDGRRVYYGGAELDENHTVKETQLVAYVSGASMLVSRKFWDSEGLMDEDFFLYYEDNELCARCVKQGWSILYQPRSIVYHKGGASIGDWLGSTLSIYYSTRNFLLLCEKRNLIDRKIWMLLKMTIWDEMVKSKENIRAFCDGLYDFLLGRKGPRKPAVDGQQPRNLKEESLLKEFLVLKRLFSRLENGEVHDAIVEALLGLAFRFYEAFKKEIVALRLQDHA